MLLPVRCPGCGALGGAPCPACAATLRPAPSLPPPPSVDRCLAVLAYEGVARDLVARLKYRNHRDALAGLAAAMAALVLAPGTVDAVTWAPTTPARRRGRGFDHAELLARAVARRLHRPCRRLLDRHPGPAQTGRNRAERGRGPVVTPRGRCPPSVLLVDDVVTTGATVSAAAGALRAAGAVHVTVLAAARTPVHPRAWRAKGQRGA